MSTGQNLLWVKDLGKTFGGLRALHGVSLEVKRGEICGVIGPNGAGKSTFFNLLAGAFPPSAGQVNFNGSNITGKPGHEVAWSGIARAFQLVNLFDSMTAGQNILIGAELHERFNLIQALTHGFGYKKAKQEAVERAERAVRLVGIEQLVDKPVVTLTYGQQRLVSAARALAAWPSLLLLDEPAAGLSELEIEALEWAVRAARDAGVTILLIEHNVGFVMRLCDHVAVLHFGEKIADGTPEEMKSNPAVSEAYLGH